MTKTGSLANDKEEEKKIIENSQINQMLKFREVLKWLLQNKAVGHKNGGGGWWVKICYRILIESMGKILKKYSIWSQELSKWVKLKIRCSRTEINRFGNKSRKEKNTPVGAQRGSSGGTAELESRCAMNESSVSITNSKQGRERIGQK